MEFSPLQGSQEEPSCCRMCRFYCCEEKCADTTRCCCLLKGVGITIFIPTLAGAGLGSIYGLGLLAELVINGFSTKDFYFHPGVALFAFFMMLPFYAMIVGALLLIGLIFNWLITSIYDCCSCAECRRRYTQQYTNIDSP